MNILRGALISLSAAALLAASTQGRPAAVPSGAGAPSASVGADVDTIDCLARSRRDDRLRLLRYGVDELSGLPNATIYGIPR